LSQKRPQIQDQDVVAAWDSYWRMQARLADGPTRYDAVGFDTKGRLLEMVAVIEVRGGQEVYTVFHARKATAAFLAQLGFSPLEVRNLLGGQRHGRSQI